MHRFQAAGLVALLAICVQVMTTFLAPYEMALLIPEKALPALLDLVVFATYSFHLAEHALIAYAMLRLEVEHNFYALGIGMQYLAYIAETTLIIGLLTVCTHTVPLGYVMLLYSILVTLSLSAMEIMTTSFLPAVAMSLPIVMVFGVHPILSLLGIDTVFIQDLYTFKTVWILASISVGLQVVVLAAWLLFVQADVLRRGILARLPEDGVVNQAYQAEILAQLKEKYPGISVERLEKVYTEVVKIHQKSE